MKNQTKTTVKTNFPKSLSRLPGRNIKRNDRNVETLHATALHNTGTLHVAAKRRSVFGRATSLLLVSFIFQYSLTINHLKAQVIAGGASHSLFACADSTVRSCGLNAYGQLGNGTTTSTTLAVQVSGLTGITAVAAGQHHSLFLKNDGTVWACGFNLYGQLGDGTTANKTLAVQVTGLCTVVAPIPPSLKAYIPDINFRNFLNTNYPAFMDGSGDSLLIDSAATLTGVLNCSNQNIADLTGVEYFVNITQLWCYNNQLTALPDFTNNTALYWLDCANNKLDFSDARALRIADTISTLTTYIYSPQDPFGVAVTFNLNAGETLILSIANQDSALSYQWFRGTDTIMGATDTLLIIPNVTLAENGVYTCRSYGTALDTNNMIWGPGISSFVSEEFLVNISPVGIKDPQGFQNL
ncbi:MAG: hypothetical protein FVQ77_11430, partial [Cytophagales bacterium]|nr:hypothetical protein [Cytophagales bacterium]